MLTGIARYALVGISGTDIRRAPKHILLGFMAHLTEGNMFLILHIWPRTHGWGAHRPQD